MPRLRVREIAEAQGLDASKLSRRADLAYRTVLMLWNDPYRDVNLSTLAKLARALNVSVTDLLENGDPKTEGTGCAPGGQPHATRNRGTMKYGLRFGLEPHRSPRTQHRLAHQSVRRVAVLLIVHHPVTHQPQGGANPL